MLSFLPAIVAALTSSHAHIDVPHARAHDAASQLAEALATADSIDWVAENDPTITFGIERGNATMRVTVTMRAGGDVASIDIEPTGEAHRKAGTTGVLSWLGRELRDADAVGRLAIEPDGEILVGTSDGRSYLVITDHEAGGNAGVESRWAAAWDAPTD